jgi:hypothetical protein
LPKLKYTAVGNTKVSPVGAKRLKAAAPDVEIYPAQLLK